MTVLAGCGAGPVEVDPPSLSEEQSAACRELVDALPDRLAGEERREVDPDEGLTAAWGDPAIVLTCGVGRPEGYVPEGPCTVVDDVDWYVPEEQLLADGDEDLVMTTLFRDVNVEVRLPRDYWPPATALADLAQPVSDHSTPSKRCL